MHDNAIPSCIKEIAVLFQSCHNGKYLNSDNIALKPGYFCYFATVQSLTKNLTDTATVNENSV